MEDLPTYYDVLEIAETASPAEASAAYRRMVKEYHPDRLVGLPDHLTKLREDAQEKWQEIQEAWDVLSDPIKRAQYDEGLKELRGQSATPSASAPPPASHYSYTAPPPSYSSATSSQATSNSSAASGTQPPYSAPPAAPPTPVASGLSRGWAIAIGWIVFIAVLVFGQAVEMQSLGSAPPQSPAWLAGAIFYSLFGAAMLAGVAITGLLRRKRNRAVIAAVFGAASTVTFIVLLGSAAIGPGQPKPPASNSGLSPTAVAAGRTPVLDCRNLALRLYNIDDTFQASLTNAAAGSQVILQVPERQDTGFVDLSSRTRPGLNTLSLQLTNYRGGYTYGYQLRSDSRIIDQASCGQVGVLGCNNNDQKRGTVFTHSFAFECPGTPQQSAGAAHADASRNGESAEPGEAKTEEVNDPKASAALSAANVNWEEIAFAIGPCSVRGGSISCPSRITNSGTDRHIRLGLARDSRIIDGSGHEFPVSGGELGASSCRGCDVSGTLVNGVPIAGNVTFGEAHQDRAMMTDLSAIAVLELRVNLDERGWNTLQFRNVPIRGTVAKAAQADKLDNTNAGAAATAEFGQISFSIGPCSAQGDSVICATRLLNKGDDRHIRLGLARDSRIIDDSGHEFPVSGGQLGASSCRGCDVSSTLVNGVPIVGKITFAEARRDRNSAADSSGPTSAITLLELRVNIEERAWNTLQFRNIPISK